MEKKDVSLPPSEGYIVFDPQLCTGCHVCEAVCSFVKEEGRIHPEAARIRVRMDPFGGTVENFMPEPCLQCDSPQCMLACPVEGAMSIDEETGARVIIEDICIKCGKCMEACGAYFDTPRIVYHPEKKGYVKCDLCKGSPECVKWCPNGSLKYVTRAEFVEKGGKHRQSFVEAYEKDFGPAFKPFEGVKWRFKGPWLQEER